jgi:hypothetical protein
MLPTLFLLLVTVQSAPSPQPPPTSRIEVMLPILGSRWERARWIDQPRLLRVLGADLDLRSFQKDACTSADEVVRRVLRLKDSTFVGGIDNGRFTGLIARRTLLEKIGTKVAEEKE